MNKDNNLINAGMPITKIAICASEPVHGARRVHSPESPKNSSNPHNRYAIQKLLKVLPLSITKRKTQKFEVND